MQDKVVNSSTRAFELVCAERRTNHDRAGWMICGLWAGREIMVLPKGREHSTKQHAAVVGSGWWRGAAPKTRTLPDCVRLREAVGVFWMCLKLIVLLGAYFWETATAVRVPRSEILQE